MPNVKAQSPNRKQFDLNAFDIDLEFEFWYLKFVWREEDGGNLCISRA